MVQGWLKQTKTKRGVLQPNTIFSDNKHMGGVDHHDWLIGKYSVSIRGNKWYWTLLTRFIDMAMVNSWAIYRIIHQGDSNPQVSALDSKELSVHHSI